MQLFIWFAFISLFATSSQAERKNNNWKMKLEQVETKLYAMIEKQETFQNSVEKKFDNLQEYIEKALTTFTEAIEPLILDRENIKTGKSTISAKMSADEPLIEIQNNTEKISKVTPSLEPCENSLLVLKSLEKSLVQMHKKEMRRLNRLQSSLDKNLESQMMKTEPVDLKEPEPCFEVERTIRSMNADLERDHKDIQQGMNLLQNQMSLDMGTGLRAMQLDILQCTRSVTELHRSLIGVSKRGISERLDDHSMQQDQPSLYIFNRHPTPIGKPNEYLQELPVPHMKVVSSVLNGRPRSCAEIYYKGFQKSGIFSIWPQFNSSARLQLYAYCDMLTDGGGWTVIQRRGDFGNGHENFTRLWSDYKKGFGHTSREFWLGLDPIYALSNQDQVELRIEILTWSNETRYANYDVFKIADESDFYRLTVGNFTGDVEDCFSSYHNNFKFSTIDSNNAGHISRQCAVYQGEGGGWWYDNCYMVKLNSIYYPQGNVGRGEGIQWRCWSGYWYSLKHAEMKVRPLCFKEKCNF